MIQRRGFTLIELLITAVVMAILGTMLARMLVSDSRFVGRIEAMMSARQVARAAGTIMSSDLRMVAPGMVVTATATEISFNMPIAWGMACQRSGNNVIGSIIPTDSLTLASSGVEGVIWIDATGAQNFFSATVAIIGGPRPECTADSIRTLNGGQLMQISPLTVQPLSVIPSGSIFYTFDTIQYEFKASVSHPGRIGLWRYQNAFNIDEEILAPFDTTSRFEFVTSANGMPSVTPPVVLSDLIAVEMVVLGESLQTPRDATDPEEFELRTRITFVN